MFGCVSGTMLAEITSSRPPADVNTRVQSGTATLTLFDEKVPELSWRLTSLCFTLQLATCKRPCIQYIRNLED